MGGTATEGHAAERWQSGIVRARALMPPMLPNKTYVNMAPEVGFEPTTNRLTADRSTTELRWIFCAAREGVNFAQPSRRGK